LSHSSDTAVSPKQGGVGKTISQTEQKPQGGDLTLHERLYEAEETLRALRSGEVDAVVAGGPEGDQVYTLQGADAVYRLMVQEMAEGAMTVLPSGLILFSNEQCGATLGLPTSSLLGASIYDYVAPEDRDVFEDLLRGLCTLASCVRLKRAGATPAEVPARVSATSLLLQTTEYVCLVITDLSEQERRNQELATEISRSARAREELQSLNADLERQSAASRQAEEESRRSERRFLGAAESSMDSLYFCDAIRDKTGNIKDFLFTYVNSNALNLTTFSFDEVVGGRMCELFPINLKLGLFENYKHTVLTGEPFVGEFRIEEETILTEWLRIQAVKLEDGVVISASNVTDRKRQEEVLRKSEALLKRTERLTDIGGWEFDLISGELFWSAEIYRILGTDLNYRPTLEAAIGLYVPEDRPRIKAAIEKASAGGEAWDMECTIVTTDGRHVPVRVVGEVEFENGQPIRLTGAFKDISRKVAERNSLAVVTERLKMATDSSGTGIWDWDIVNDRLTWDPWMYRLYDLEPRDEEVAYELWTRHLHPEDRSQAEHQIQQAIEGVKPFDTEFRIIWDDKSIHYIRATGHVTRDATGQALRIVGTNLDVTARKRNEMELARLANFTQSIIASSPFATIVTDLRGVITSVNPAAERMLLYNKEDLIQWETPLVLLNQEQVAARATLLSEQLQSTIEPGIEVLTANPQRAKLDEAKWELVRRDGSRFDANVTVAALTETGNHINGYILTAYDITAQQREERRTQKALVEKQVLLQEVHHRVKNNLQVICSLLNMQAESADDSKTEHALLDSHNRVHSMAMIHEMLYGSETLQGLDFETYTRALLEELFSSYKIEGHRIKTQFTMTPMKFSIDRAVPCGLILNELISNSLKYAFPADVDGEIRVSLSPSGRDRCELLVEDTGVGLPESFCIDHADSLGLKIVDVLVKQLGGEYKLFSNQGTRFRMDFPL
jgi:PAS domain S-box-containing protein